MNDWINEPHAVAFGAVLVAVKLWFAYQGALTMVIDTLKSQAQIAKGQEETNRILNERLRP